VPTLDLVAVGLALGFSLVIPPGPMNALIAVRSVRSVRAGVTTGLGAMAADLVLAVVVYAVHSAVDLAPLVRYIEGAGAIVMGYLAYRVLAHARDEVAPAPPRDVRLFTETLLVGLTNPYQIVWWLTAGLAFAYLGGVVLLVGLFAAITVWILVFPLAIHHGARRSPRLPWLVAVISGLLLAGFAAYFALLAVGVLR
jgi:threonine/homoserine/homoserine lactone efflux protein